MFKIFEHLYLEILEKSPDVGTESDGARLVQGKSLPQCWRTTKWIYAKVAASCCMSTAYEMIAWDLWPTVGGAVVGGGPGKV